MTWTLLIILLDGSGYTFEASIFDTKAQCENGVAFVEMQLKRRRVNRFVKRKDLFLSGCYEVPWEVIEGWD